ncbi:hypothetical protein HMPREF1219_00822 [Corynebacterium pyruviciproducens ATCC BAA-1742]|uniref:NlpC/P60 domain-containing protein n=1 Tax=Corynebacterium pyruviciproducens ATCC BAA-1742 TaxID=1125779 RepID=S2ZIH8_9CORY|nr:hypothetical protein [Corynebacterium pyruviciproducens]EPD69877.1 hypothetical protein HMPREF1219_00822 [Corynebacterium pyruviciproducens ATCC BAA-1742]
MRSVLCVCVVACLTFAGASGAGAEESDAGAFSPALEESVVLGSDDAVLGEATSVGGGAGDVVLDVLNTDDFTDPQQVERDKQTTRAVPQFSDAELAALRKANRSLRVMRQRSVAGCAVFAPLNKTVCGAILEKYLQLGGPTSFLLTPVSDELTNPDGVGKRTQFLNGMIYWHPRTGAWSVPTHFMPMWGRTGYEQGPLGYPTSDEHGTRVPMGRKQYFEHGALLWKLNQGVAVYGEIFKKYEQMGAENSWLGFPVADEVGLPDGVGRMSRFENGWIYWHPATGAHPVNIGVFRQWQEQGYEVGSWGYPTSDGVEDPGTAMISQDFQGGRYRGWNNPASAIGVWAGFSILPEVIRAALEYVDGDPAKLNAALREGLAEMTGQPLTTSYATERSANPQIFDFSRKPQDKKPLIETKAQLRRSGDIYYNWAGRGSKQQLVEEGKATAANYGHVGIFVNPNTAVEAEGIGKTARFIVTPDNVLRPGLRYFHVPSASSSQVSSATAFASFHARNKTPYDLNFAFNKSFGPHAEDKLNCSELVWRAYMRAAPTINLDSNRGPGVYPFNIVRSGLLEEY